MLGRRRLDSADPRRHMRYAVARHLYRVAHGALPQIITSCSIPRALGSRSPGRFGRTPTERRDQVSRTPRRRAGFPQA